jgi:2,4-dienoyl-CoA reductase-like NADH-dependent reductase (Old Yellow Enzyme family)
MRRVLAPDGRVGLSVWQGLARHPVYQALFEATARHLGVPMSAVDAAFSLEHPEALRALLDRAEFERIDITPRSLEVTVQSPELFVQLTVRGAATSVPAFARLDAPAQSALVQAEAIVSTGDADLIALARTILYNPRWPWHAAAHFGAQVKAPDQYLRSQPRQYPDLFDIGH